MNSFSFHNLTIVLWFGYFIVVQLTIRLAVYKKESCVLYIVTLSHPLKISIHVKNMQILATEMFKISKKFTVPLMSKLFHQKNYHYDLQNPYESSIPNVNSVFHG